MNELLIKGCKFKIDFCLCTSHLIRSKTNEKDVLIKKKINFINQSAKDLNRHQPHQRYIETVNNHIKIWPYQISLGKRKLKQHCDTNIL